VTADKIAATAREMVADGVRPGSDPQRA
jgi:hypothetical protein